MKRKKINNQEKPAWQVWWELAKYPAKIPLSKKMCRADVVFCLMRWLGMSKIDSFLTAYPDTTASRNSLALWLRENPKSRGFKNILMHCSTMSVRKI